MNCVTSDEVWGMGRGEGGEGRHKRINSLRPHIFFACPQQETMN